MRIPIIALTLALLIVNYPTQAGAITRGNLFTEGFAGCSLGIAVGTIGSLVIASQVPVAGAVAANQMGLVRYCLIGTAIAITLTSILKFSDMNSEFFRLQRAMEEKAPMIYPETPGREY